MEIKSLRYVQADDYNRPEMVVMDVVEPHHVRPAMLAVMPFLYDGVRTITCLDDAAAVPLEQEQVVEVCEFIRQQRNEIKYSYKPKTYMEWQRLGISLEDYMPIGTLISEEWAENISTLQTTSNVIQLGLPYEEPFDRPAQELDVYYTFLKGKRGWEFVGVCAYNSPINMVPEANFYGKIVSTGPEQVEYFENRISFDNQVMHYKLYGRPFTACYPSRSLYLQEAGGIRAKVDPVAEAQEVLWKLYYQRPNNYAFAVDGTVWVKLSASFTKAVQSADIEALIKELPFTQVTYHEKALDGVGVGFLCIPEEQCNTGVVAHRPASEAPTPEQIAGWQAEAQQYFIHGGEYIIGGMLFCLYRFSGFNAHNEAVEQGVFLDSTGKSIFALADGLWNNLPDIALPGRCYVAVDDERYQPLPYLTPRVKAHVEKALARKLRVKIGGRCSFTTLWGHTKNGTISSLRDFDPVCIVRGDDGMHYYTRKDVLEPEQEHLGAKGGYIGKPMVQFAAQYHKIFDRNSLTVHIRESILPPFSKRQPGQYHEQLLADEHGDPVVEFPDGSAVVFRYEDLIHMAHQFKLCADAGFADEVTGQRAG